MKGLGGEGHGPRRYTTSLQAHMTYRLPCAGPQSEGQIASLGPEGVSSGVKTLLDSLTALCNPMTWRGKAQFLYCFYGREIQLFPSLECSAGSPAEAGESSPGVHRHFDAYRGYPLWRPRLLSTYACGNASWSRHRHHHLSLGPNCSHGKRILQHLAYHPVPHSLFLYCRVVSLWEPKLRVWVNESMTYKALVQRLMQKSGSVEKLVSAMSVSKGGGSWSRPNVVCAHEIAVVPPGRDRGLGASVDCSGR